MPICLPPPVIALPKRKPDGDDVDVDCCSSPFKSEEFTILLLRSARHHVLRHLPYDARIPLEPNKFGLVVRRIELTYMTRPGDVSFETPSTDAV